MSDNRDDHDLSPWGPEEDGLPRLEEFLSHFKRVEALHDGSFLVLCPAREGSRPGLHVSLGEGGQIRLYDLGGCETKDVLARTGLDWDALCWDESPCLAPHPWRVRRAKTSHEVGLSNRVYRDLLSLLTLAEEDRAALRERGLSDEAIARNGYRTMKFFPVSRASTALGRRYGDRLFRVPGFWEYKGKVVILPDEGLLIPVRDAQGRIVTCQIRDSEEGPDYDWLAGEIGSAILPHVPLGIGKPCPLVRVTEGPLQADVAYALDPSVPVIAVPGVVTWHSVREPRHSLLPLLRELGAEGVRLTFDADWQTKPDVAGALLSCAEALEGEGFTVEVEQWEPAAGKGLDDLLKAGGVPVAVKLDEARRRIEEALARGQDRSGEAATEDERGQEAVS
jgi:hypothetical protein